jgi:glycosyltransferase 2 family protein
MVLRSATLGWVARACAGVAILVGIFTLIPFSEVAAVLAAVDLRYIALAILIMTAERYVAALRIKILTDQNRMGLSSLAILEINTIAAFYAMFLPGELAGGAVRWYKMSRPSGKRAEAFAAIVFARLIDTAGLFLVGLAFWLLDDPPVDGGPVAFLAALAVIILSALILVSLDEALTRRLLKTLALLPQVALVRFVCAKLQKVAIAVGEYRELPPVAFLALAILTLGRHILTALALYCYALALGINVPLVALVWIRCLLSLMVMLPLTVGGLGVREVSLMFLLGLYGVSRVDAVALALLTLIMRVLFAAAGGLLEIKSVLLGGRHPKSASSS